MLLNLLKSISRQKTWTILKLCHLIPFLQGSQYFTAWKIMVVWFSSYNRRANLILITLSWLGWVSFRHLNSGLDINSSNFNFIGWNPSFNKPTLFDSWLWQAFHWLDIFKCPTYFCTWEQACEEWPGWVQIKCHNSLWLRVWICWKNCLGPNFGPTT